MQKCRMALQIQHWSWPRRETSSISTWLTLSSHRIRNIEQVVWSDGRNLHLSIYLSISILPQYSAILLCSCLQLLWPGVTCHTESGAPKCLAIMMWALSPVIWHPLCRYWVCDSELSDSGVKRFHAPSSQEVYWSKIIPPVCVCAPAPRPALLSWCSWRHAIHEF